MSKYVDGFVIPIRADKLEEYRVIAARAGEIWKEHGALDYVECAGDDLDVEKMLGFRQLAGAGEEETVLFSYIVYESREHRDSVNEKVMADPRIHEMGPEEMPFDSSRMAYGGFRSIVAL